MIYLYKILGFILIPLIKINLHIRIKNRKESKSRYKERYGISNLLKKNNKKIMWIHAASVGEFKSADFFIETYYKKYNLLITTTTLSAAQYAESHYGNKIIHQFAPFDVSLWVKKFLTNWDPFFIIWIESDLWPATLDIIKKQKRKAILVNARMSPNSFNRWKRIQLFYSDILICFSSIFAQSKLDQQRINFLTKRNIKFIGNLKFVNKNIKLNKILNLQSNKEEDALTLMIANTHNDEESRLFPIIKNLLDNNKNIRIIIAPRHPERANKITSLCHHYNLSSNLESAINKRKKNILIINSFGNLSSYYFLSDIVFLGGSLVSSGGHNPIEPATQKCVIITGPIIYNWENTFHEMVDKKACIIIKSISELKKNLEDLINDSNKRDIIKDNAYTFAKKQFVDTKVIEKTINDEIKI